MLCTGDRTVCVFTCDDHVQFLAKCFELADQPLLLLRLLFSQRLVSVEAGQGRGTPSPDERCKSSSRWCYYCCKGRIRFICSSRTGGGIESPDCHRATKQGQVNCCGDTAVALLLRCEHTPKNLTERVRRSRRRKIRSTVGHGNGRVRVLFLPAPRVNRKEAHTHAPGCCAERGRTPSRAEGRPSPPSRRSLPQRPKTHAVTAKTEGRQQRCCSSKLSLLPLPAALYIQ